MAIYSLRRNPKARTPQGQRGVSLIEVMIALVVLTTGILALALLQVKVTRGAADAKVRSFALGYAQEELERQRASTVTLANYTALTDLPVDKVSATATNIGGSVEATGVQFKSGLQVRRFYRETVAANCAAA